MNTAYASSFFLSFFEMYTAAMIAMIANKPMPMYKAIGAMPSFELAVTLVFL